MQGIKRCIKATLLATIVLLAISCSSRKNEIDKSGIIPENKLPGIIADLYLTDGLLTLPYLQKWYTSPDPSDSITAYQQVIENHGYTKEAFDKTIRFYYIKKPRQLLKIYDKALAELSEFESRTEQDVQKAQSILRDLWKKGDYYTWPGQDSDDSTSFDVILPNPGIFIASFTLTISPYDQTLNPRFFGYVTHVDSSGTGQRIYINSMNYIKDGKPHKYAYYFIAPDMSKLRLKGFLIYHDNFYKPVNKDMIIKDISISPAVTE